MRIVGLAGAILLTTLAIGGVPASAYAQEASAPSRGTAQERSEIGRILAADNLDADALGSAGVVSTISAIPRGGAPADFWEAYQIHVRAWQRLALAERRVREGGAGEAKQAAPEMIEAFLEVEATFAEVGRIADSYGVAMPTPPGDLADTI